MENPAAYSVFSKNTAREFLANNGEITPDLLNSLKIEADLVANTYACANCDDRKCMGCIFREYNHNCEDDCPSCC